MVESDVFFETAGTDGVEKTECTQTINISSVLSHFEGNFDVGLGSEIVHFRRLDLSDDIHEIRAVTQISVMQFEFVWAC